MACERRLGLVAAVALLAGCDGSAGPTAQPPTAPTTAMDDMGGGDGDGATRAAPSCPSTPAPFAGAAIVAAADAAHLYAFADARLVRIALDGGAPETIVGDVAGPVALAATVDDHWVWWRVLGDDDVPALFRAPKDGGSAVALGSGGADVARAPFVVADPIYFAHDGIIDALPPADDAAAVNANNILTANATSVLYLDTSDRLQIHTLPTRAPPTAHGPSFVDADERSVYLLWNDELRRYAIVNSTYVVIARFDGKDLPGTLRVVGDRVYMRSGWPDAPGRLERVGLDGSHRALVADGVDEAWTVAGDSVYFDRGGDIFRVCR
jgi:hypothetical protein